MVKKIVGFIMIVLVLIFTSDISFAQGEGNIQFDTGGTAKCTFNGKVPFRKIKAEINKIVVDTDKETASVSIKSELDNDINTLSAELSATLEAISDPSIILNGEPVDFQSENLDLSISKTRNSDGRVIDVTNETADGDKTGATGSVTVTNFNPETNEASGKLKVIFEDTLRTIETDEDTNSTENGKVVVRCTFDSIPVTISGESLFSGPDEPPVDFPTEFPGLRH